ncbi:hypothetical protein TRAPUB_8220 [Trametes pubescens]|uniref:Uncharacterized protein n=1 Tax=Trametes pubescens TaxID=154538 RepID=A0A1M2W5Q6_TRAPU|nr:hypothetical protein TRAPUB_8220 [Trametes pubescens]
MNGSGAGMDEVLKYRGRSGFGLNIRGRRGVLSWQDWEGCTPPNSTVDHRARASGGMSQTNVQIASLVATPRAVTVVRRLAAVRMRAPSLVKQLSTAESARRLVHKATTHPRPREERN